MATFFRLIFIVICLIPLIGFGLCGVRGVIMGAAGAGIYVFALGVIGIAIAAFFLLIVKRLASSDENDSEMKDDIAE